MTVDLGKDSYPIYIENQIRKAADEYIAEVFSGTRIMIVSDDNVYPLYGEALEETLRSRFECHHIVLPHGEPTKRFDVLPDIYRALLEAGITRSDLVVALGGGVIGDLAGFAAASYLRGVNLVQIPTSLLAQVDASVGGKVAVDLPQGKNLVGAFYQPSLVLIDPEVLETLPEKFIHDGMGEVIKYGCIKDTELFNLLAERGSFKDLSSDLESVIGRCVDIKRTIVETDPFDTGERMLLNFGHTLGHAIEQYQNYEGVSHGEAVAIGMNGITRMAEEKGLTSPGTAQRIFDLLTAYDLPTSCHIPVSDLMGAVGLDKKNLKGHLNLILLHEIGNGYIYPASTAFFTEFERIIL